MDQTYLSAEDCSPHQMGPMLNFIVALFDIRYRINFSEVSKIIDYTATVLILCNAITEY